MDGISIWFSLVGKLPMRFTDIWVATLTRSVGYVTAIVLSTHTQSVSATTPAADFAAVCTPQLAASTLAAKPQTVAKPGLPQLQASVSVVRLPLDSYLVESALNVNPLILNSANHYLNLGQELYYEGNYQGAIAAYNQAIQLNPYDDRAYEYRAHSLGERH